MGHVLGTGLRSQLLWLLLPLPAVACDCVHPGPPCKAFAGTPTVFAGRVVGISTIGLKAPSGDDYEDRFISFEVERSYRGWTAKTAEVVTGWGGGDCGYDFRQGERYLVYAYPHRETGKLYTGICQRTRPLTEAAEDLDYLNKKDDPSQLSGIEGVVQELARGSPARPMAGITVKVESASGRWTALSQKDGRFRLWGLKPGSYRVTPALSGDFVPVHKIVKLEEHSCADIWLLAARRR